jgi:mono/diheme cytochrome c family protein/plastocyanin
MNTRKQVLLMVALLFIGMVGIAVYSAWDSGIGHGREAAAAGEVTEKTAGRGAILFARNCRVCHGDVGEGGALGGRLAAAPALDRPDLQGFVDSKATLAKDVGASDTEIPTSDGSKFKKGMTILIDTERMDVTGVSGNTLTVVRGVGNTSPDTHTAGTSQQPTTMYLLDHAALADKVKLITNTITCGRVGTPMPAWAQSQSGPLSDEQIRQLATLISGSLLDPVSRTPIGPTQNFWYLTREQENTGLDFLGVEHGEDVIDVHLTAEVDDSTISLPVSDVTLFAEKEAIRIGDERMLITGVPTVADNDPDKSGILTVERGALGSTPLPHATDEKIYKFPLAPDTPSINQASCGQTAKPAAPSAPPGPKECAEPCQTETITAQGVKFDKSTLTFKTGGNIKITFNNQDQGVQHNFAVYNSSSDITSVAPGSVGTIFEGVASDDIVFAAPAPGTYYFRCDVHPTIMFGTFTVTP